MTAHPAPAPARGARAAGAAVLLALLAFAVYFHQGRTLLRASAFAHDDLLFEIDVERGINDMTVYSGDHYRTSVHPIYVLLVNPLGILLAWSIGSGVQAALALNAALGALGVGLAFIFFRRLLDDAVAALLLSALFALSASQLILSSVPDTATLAVVSLVATWCLFLDSSRRGTATLRVWVPAGIFTLGVTTTNFAQTAIAFGLLCLQRRREGHPGRGEARRLVRFAAVTVAVTGLLALIQKVIYPSSGLFLDLDRLKEESDYISDLVLRAPLTVLSEIARHMFFVNVVAPLPEVLLLGHLDRARSYVTFVGARGMGPAGLAAAVAWAALLLSALHSSSRRALRGSPQAAGLALAVAFNLLLHVVYGIGEKGRIEYFLYTGNFTFAALALMAIALAVRPRLLKLLVLLLLLLAGANNLDVLARIAAVYR